jgi:hypothetical protein
VKTRRKSWLKQLRVAASTKASMPSGSSPQNSRTNFVDSHHNVREFFKKNLRKFLKSVYNQDNSKTSLTCLEIFMQNGKVGEGDVFSKKTSLLP